MVPFLQLVAEDLKRKYDDLSDFTVVFPNNRARLFFNNFLVDQSGKPMWSPSYTTIQDLFASHTHLQVADDVKLICDLYRVYLKHMNWAELGTQPETMDDFYFWGEVLLRDFEDIDHNLVDAEQLFQNISDLSALDDDVTAILSEEQKAALQKFFSHFTEKSDSIIKKKFAALWNVMLPIYSEYRNSLMEQGLCYGGMMHRLVVENLNLDRFVSKKYVFVGFNVLNKCETQFFKRLNDAGKAIFYWDIDQFYMEMDQVQHEAATFMKMNLELFKNELDKELLNEFTQSPKTFTIISSSTNNAQAKYLNKFLLERKQAQDKDAETAVVLCDESMLLSALHAIPDSVEDLNITMGLPLIQTPVYALLKSLIDMRDTIAVYGNYMVSIPYRFIRDTLSNPYVLIALKGTRELFDEIVQNNSYYPRVDRLVQQSEDTSLLFSFLQSKDQSDVLPMLEWLSQIIRRIATFYRESNSDSDATFSAIGLDADIETESALPIYNALYKEAFFRSYTLLNRLISLVKSGDLEVNIHTMCRLLEKLLAATSVPFSGEPVKGMQIMGFLETRNLDFKNVILLSVNEGILPKVGGESSFIPYNLKKGFGMTTIDHKNSLYAYYFYRLLQRSERATFMYSTATDGGSKGQMSRFLMQIMVEMKDNVTIELKDLRSEIQVSFENRFEVTKTAEMIKRLRSVYDLNSHGDHLVSPSMLNTYLNCSMRFYFTYVEGLREPEDIDDAIDNRILGLILHKTLENIYAPYVNRVVEASVIDGWKQNYPALEKEVDRAFRSEYFHDEKGEIQYSGQQLLLKMTVLSYLTHALEMDKGMAPFTIIGRESEEKMVFEVDDIKVNLGGYIDRLQFADGAYQVVDYKTGSDSVSKSSLVNYKKGDKPNDDQIVKDAIEALFSANVDRKYTSYALQVWLYTYIYYHKKHKPVVPYLMFVRSGKGLINVSLEKSFGNQLDGSNSNMICGEIEENLRSLLREIFSLEQPFKKTTEIERCKYCPFAEICIGKKVAN